MGRNKYLREKTFLSINIFSAGKPMKNQPINWFEVFQDAIKLIEEKKMNPVLAFQKARFSAEEKIQPSLPNIKQQVDRLV